MHITRWAWSGHQPTAMAREGRRLLANTCHATPGHRIRQVSVVLEARIEARTRQMGQCRALSAASPPPVSSMPPATSSPTSSHAPSSLITASTGGTASVAACPPCSPTLTVRCYTTAPTEHDKGKQDHGVLCWHTTAHRDSRTEHIVSQSWVALEVQTTLLLNLYVRQTHTKYHSLSPAWAAATLGLEPRPAEETSAA